MTSLPSGGAGAGAGASTRRTTTIKDIPMHLLKGIIEMACPRITYTKDQYPILQRQLVARKRLVCKHFNEAIGSNTQMITFRRHATIGSLEFNSDVQEKIFSSICSTSSYRNLRGIDFSNIVCRNRLGNDGVNLLAQAMRTKPLVSLNLSNNEIGSKGMKSLFLSLETNPVIQVLI